MYFYFYFRTRLDFLSQSTVQEQAGLDKEWMDPMDGHCIFTSKKSEWVHIEIQSMFLKCTLSGSITICCVQRRCLLTRRRSGSRVALE